MPSFKECPNCGAYTDVCTCREETGGATWWSVIFAAIIFGLGYEFPKAVDYVRGHLLSWGMLAVVIFAVCRLWRRK